MGRLTVIDGGGRSGVDKPTLCPAGYGNPQAWCDWRNAEMRRTDVEWIVSPTGTPMLVDRDSWSARRTAELERTADAERRRFNHRQQHPVTA